MKFKALFGLLTGGIIVYSGFWYSIGLSVERQIVGELNNLREQGVNVKHSPPELTGFPYRLQITLSDISLDARKNGWRITADDVTAIGHVWAPDNWYLRLRGTNASALAGGLSLSGDDILSNIKWSGNGVMQVSFDLSTTRAQGKIFDGNSITAEKAELHIMTPPPNGRADQNLLSPLIFKGALRVAGATSDNSSFQILDRGEMLFSLHGKGLDGWTDTALANWRDGGGTVEITALSVEWGQSLIEGNASLTLDEDFKPLGAATLTLKNADSMMKKLKRLDLLTDQPDKNSGTIALMAQGGELTADGQRITKLKNWR